MNLADFYRREQATYFVTPTQASRFAKEVAGDFNPIHDEDAKRFCVPGDLIFALALKHYGISQEMKFSFSGMVGRDKGIVLPESNAAEVDVCDDTGKVVTQISRQGDTTQDSQLIETLTREYVAFSGQNFPYILQPLLEKAGVMFNPKRPLVIYDSMAFHLDRLSLNQPSLHLANTQFDVNGKRGDTQFFFDIKDQGQVVGQGRKTLIVSGLQPYDSEAMQAVVDNFLAAKSQYAAEV